MRLKIGLLILVIATTVFVGVSVSQMLPGRVLPTIELVKNGSFLGSGYRLSTNKSFVVVWEATDDSLHLVLFGPDTPIWFSNYVSQYRSFASHDQALEFANGLVGSATESVQVYFRDEWTAIAADSGQ